MQPWTVSRQKKIWALKKLPVRTLLTFFISLLRSASKLAAENCIKQLNTLAISKSVNCINPSFCTSVCQPHPVIRRRINSLTLLHVLTSYLTGMTTSLLKATWSVKHFATDKLDHLKVVDLFFQIYDEVDHWSAPPLLRRFRMWVSSSNPSSQRNQLNKNVLMTETILMIFFKLKLFVLKGDIFILLMSIKAQKRNSVWYPSSLAIFHFLFLIELDQAWARAQSPGLKY